MSENDKTNGSPSNSEIQVRTVQSGERSIASEILGSHEDATKTDEPPVSTALGDMTLSMFAKGQYVRVRVGAAHNATELYEHAYESAEEANAALLDAGILTAEQVPDSAQVAGTGIAVHGVTAEQLESAGLKRHLSGSL